MAFIANENTKQLTSIGMITLPILRLLEKTRMEAMTDVMKAILANRDVEMDINSGDKQ